MIFHTYEMSFHYKLTVEAGQPPTAISDGESVRYNSFTGLDMDIQAGSCRGLVQLQKCILAHHFAAFGFSAAIECRFLRFTWENCCILVLPLSADRCMANPQLQSVMGNQYDITHSLVWTWIYKPGHVEALFNCRSAYWLVTSLPLVSQQL
ncbi:uncharacterized protein LOC110012456 [Sesamum indicum]|uniref:Uncharacterized protein LOC110012456 n=1 Tax=Sesamum indicum TaxID=4182 RepID=A0A8M8V717_SESIN|nr:uncharacterized protein LOC110012456 [Sesamum indicum]